MIKPTPKQIKQVLTILEPGQFMRLVHVVMGLRSQEQWQAPLGAHAQLSMYIYEWLVHLGCLSEDKIRWLLKAVELDLVELATWLDANFANWPCTPNAPVFVLSITDRRYAIWPGQIAWSDLQDEARVASLTQPGVTHILGDCFAMFLVKQRWLKNMGY